MQLQKPDRRLEDRQLPAGIEVVHWQGWAGWLSLPRVLMDINRIIEQIQPDVIHAGPIQQAAFYTSLLEFRPLVSMSWGSDILLDAQRGWGRFAARHVLKRSSVLLCDCLAVQEQAVELGMPGERIVVFPWGVDLEHFQPPTERVVPDIPGWADDSIIFLSTRTMEPLYGVDISVKAFLAAAAGDSRLKLMLLGDGSMRRKIEKRVSAAGLQAQVSFQGQISFNELPGYYQRADVYISSSFSDGSSISLLEAMACGLPALVSDIPGNREWVSEEVNGWRFLTGDAGELTKCMQIAAQDLARCQEFGRQARLIAIARANWNQNIKLLFESYAMAVASEEKSKS